jgi:hypothetical protein
MARRRQGEPGVTVLLLCWVGGCDRVIVPASPPLGKGRGIYTINIPDINTTSTSSPPTFNRQDLFGQLAQLVSLVFSFVLASSSSPPPSTPSTNRRLPSLRHLVENHREARNTIHHRSRAVGIRFATAILSGLSIAASSSHTSLSDRDLLDPSFASSLILYITQAYTASTLLYL